MKIDKDKLRTVLLGEMRGTKEKLAASAEAAHRGAIHEDAIAKSKYETHGLELGYLANSQYERIKRLESDIALFQEMSLRDFSEKDCIEETAVVKLESHFYFISRFGAGYKFELDYYWIQVISPQSPLGSMLIGSFLGDTVEFSNKDQKIQMIK